MSDRCRSLAIRHREARWLSHDLIAKSDESVFVLLAKYFGWTEVLAPSPAPSVTPTHRIFADRSVSDKLGILAELLDSLALRVASDVYGLAAQKHSLPQARRRLEIASYVAVSHNMDLREQTARGMALSRKQDLAPRDHVAIQSQLAFAQLIAGRKAGVWTTFRLRRMTRQLEVEARGLLCQSPSTWNPDERQTATVIAQSRAIFAHNILRLAWFHLPGALGIIARVARRLGLRFVLAQWARRTLAKNKQLVLRIGDLAAIGNLEREQAHALCLIDRWDESLKSAMVAEEALGWGRWFQWQANSVRTRGWIWLHIGGRVRRLADYADGQAEKAFIDALDLAQRYALTRGEMVYDRIKALLELKRLAAIRSAEFEWEEQLKSDLEVVRERNPGAHARYVAMSNHTPKSREPLG